MHYFEAVLAQGPDEAGPRKRAAPCQIPSAIGRAAVRNERGVARTRPTVAEHDFTRAVRLCYPVGQKHDIVGEERLYMARLPEERRTTLGIDCNVSIQTIRLLVAGHKNLCLPGVCTIVPREMLSGCGIYIDPADTIQAPAMYSFEQFTVQQIDTVRYWEPMETFATDKVQP
ncbi:hypothetical protein T440DRAFT_503766 [Plenodomus tracheiphilus IPT5]|uniref:Uncharacterized protein n=1 Tax=Plenodomus tracheiphilus IPT5 TaxID=1408161 RepID=A0A6A7BKU7_9PLEO|nr:hypothetical protein T440DRAFT_503766 [Plenodomus tracheiphilus IPT5]